MDISSIMIGYKISPVGRTASSTQWLASQAARDVLEFLKYLVESFLKPGKLEQIVEHGHEQKKTDKLADAASQSEKKAPPKHFASRAVRSFDRFRQPFEISILILIHELSLSSLRKNQNASAILAEAFPHRNFTLLPLVLCRSIGRFSCVRKWCTEPKGRRARK